LPPILFETLYGQYPGAQDSTWRTVYALTYVTNWIWAFHPLENFGGLGALAPLWSLAIEEQFYLVWPPILALFLMRRVKPVYVGGFLLAFIAGSMARRYFLWEFASPERAYFGTDSHADPILVGCLLSVAVHRIKDRFWVMIQPWLGAIVPFALLTVIVGMIAISHQHAPILTAICTALLITAVTIAPVKLSVRIFEMSWLRWFGRISYSLYLWHSVSNMYLLKYELVDSTIVRALIGVLLAVASYYLIEMPALKFKSRRISAKLKPAPLLPLLHSQKRIFADN
jgi:peptidoglycan/LPS O-acetylase OafA/YrhL